jgi:glycosyltransferase involved in cell wall biosynthesis
MAESDWSPAKVSVVIPCRDCAPTIRRLVLGLLDQKLPAGTALEIIVADNGSTDGSAYRIRDLPVQIVFEPRRGPAAARNAGLRTAGGAMVVFLDADTRPADRFLVMEHIRTLRRSEDIWLSGGSISPDPEQHNPIALAENMTGLFNWHNGMPARFLRFQPTGNLAFRRELVERIGALKESLLWLEDFDWSVRVLRAGGKIFFNPKAAVYIRGRESFLAAIRKFYRWGINVRSVYVPGRSEQLWVFKNHPSLFHLNAPLRVLNETYVTLKRWFPKKPLATITALPLILLFRTAWGAGIAAGTLQEKHLESDCRDRAKR